MESLAYEHVERFLRDNVQAVVPAVDGHLADYGEVIPHVLFGQLTRFVLRARERDDLVVVGECLECFDEMLRIGDNAVQNLVAVSFVENVGPGDPAQSAFIATWPEGLRLEAQRQRDWTPH